MDHLPLSPDSDLVAPVAGLLTAAAAVDAPWVHPVTESQLRGRMRYGWDLEPGAHHVVLDAGVPVALGVLHASEWDNRDLAWLELTVHPDHRGRGVGGRAWTHLEELASARARPKRGCDSWEGSPGVAFAVARGFTEASRAINRRQHLAQVDPTEVRRLYDEAAAAATAYELVRIIGPTPEDLLPGVAQVAAAINDAPLDELDLEDEVFPPQRIRDYESATESRGERLYRLLVRHRETGELAGHTVVVVEAERPAIGHQHDTSVVRAHRGHRLGLLLKAGMNLWLADEEPALETIDTWNAESNDHMIAVNEQLGYRWMGRAIQLQHRR